MSARAKIAVAFTDIPRHAPGRLKVFLFIIIIESRAFIWALEFHAPHYAKSAASRFRNFTDWWHNQRNNDTPTHHGRGRRTANYSITLHSRAVGWQRAENWLFFINKIHLRLNSNKIVLRRRRRRRQQYFMGCESTFLLWRADFFPMEFWRDVIRRDEARPR